MKEKLSITWKAPTKQKEFYFQKKEGRASKENILKETMA